MAGAMVCPSCGESEELRGEQTAGDIMVTCLSCGAQWMRGGPRCAGCGGRDIIHRPQAMTRHSRGTQLSIIGWREIPLCRSCDAAALDTSITQNVPVPSDYVAACLSPAQTSSAATAPPVTPSAPPPAAKPAPRTGATPAPAAGTSAGPRTPARSRPTPPRAAPSPAMTPTVRQAVAAFMAEASGQADATAMLLLGTHLGSHNRLGVLEEDGAADQLAEWCRGHWGDGSDRAHRAVSTICRAVDFWGARGWLASDPAAGLR